MMQLRAATVNDRAFIFSTFLKGVRFGMDLYSEIDEKVFFEQYPKVVETLLSRSEISVMCLAEDPDVILGYAVRQGSVLHWTFVKKAWRKQGIAAKLCEGVTEVTHLTRPGTDIKNKKKLKYNPFLC